MRPQSRGSSAGRNTIPSRLSKEVLVDTQHPTVSTTGRNAGVVAVLTAGVVAALVATYLVASIILEALGIDVPLVNWPL
jgi:hypothetical protein